MDCASFCQQTQKNMPLALRFILKINNISNLLLVQGVLGPRGEMTCHFSRHAKLLLIVNSRIGITILNEVNIIMAQGLGHMAQLQCPQLFLSVNEVGHPSEWLFNIPKNGYNQGKLLRKLQNAIKMIFCLSDGKNN